MVLIFIRAFFASGLERVEKSRIRNFNSSVSWMKWSRFWSSSLYRASSSGWVRFNFRFLYRDFSWAFDSCPWCRQSSLEKAARAASMIRTGSGMSRDIL